MKTDTQNIIYTAMQTQHISGVAQLDILCFDDEAWSLSLFANELKDQSKRYVVAVKENNVIAYGGYAHIIDEAHIMNIAVAPTYRKSGIGQSIVEYLISDAKSRGIVAMTLEVKSHNDAAKALYEKLGFVLSGARKKYYKNTQDALIYWKQL